MTTTAAPAGCSLRREAAKASRAAGKRTWPRLRHRRRWAAWALAAAATVPGQGAEAPAPTADATGPAQSLDVYQAVMRLQLDLEALRWVAGEPVLDAAPWIAVATTPRHLFYQAQVLFGKASQIADEIAGPRILPLPDDGWRRSLPRPAPQDRQVELDDVLRVITDAHDRVRAVIELQNIRTIQLDLPVRETVTAGEVLTAIVQANWQLDLLLNREVPPLDAYNLVMSAVNRTGDLLGGVYPTASDLVIGERPLDAYRRLISCMDLLQLAGEPGRAAALGLDIDRELARENVTVADVHHLAATLLSDLDHMASELGSQATKPPKGEYPRPRFVFPSHIDQMAAVLQEQLRLLAASAEAAAAEDG